MNNFNWYKIVDSSTPLTQGDLIDDCPVITWNGDVTAELSGQMNQVLVDCVVMTQTCDLEQAKVREVILCPYYCLSEYEPLWNERQVQSGQGATLKAWRKFLDDVVNGKIWNLAMLNEFRIDDKAAHEIKIVDFHEIFSVPRLFLESWLSKHEGQRLCLLPPYREHLSQSFARYFMRVGLPVDIPHVWESRMAK